MSTINISNAVMYPTYKCSVSSFEKELRGDLQLYKEFGGKDYLDKLDGGIDCSKLESMHCMRPILPKCLSLLNIKTLEGKRQAAKMLLNVTGSNVIPNNVLYNPNGTIRVDTERFKEFYEYIKSKGMDWHLGEVFVRNSHNWMWNCYVVDEELASSEVVELPIMVAYPNENCGVKMRFIGCEGDTMYFMFSNIDLPGITL